MTVTISNGIGSVQTQNHLKIKLLYAFTLHLLHCNTGASEDGYKAVDYYGSKKEGSLQGY